MKSIGLISLILAAFIVASSADEKLFKKYGMMKIFESCFGPELHKTYLMKMKEAAYKCKKMPMKSMDKGGSSSTGSNAYNSFSGYSSESSRPSFNRNSYGPGPKPFSSPMSLQGIDWSKFMPQQGPDGIKYIPFPILIPSENIREKRQAQDGFQYYDEKMVRNLATKMHAKVSNMTCICQELGYLDDKLEIRTEYMMSEIRSMPVDYELKEDLQESVSECSNFVKCMPINPKKCAMPPALMRFKMFHKCTMKHKLTACMKKDLRKKTGEFDLSALGDVMEGADDDEKMLGILWAKSAMGGDSFDFCSLGIDDLEENDLQMETFSEASVMDPEENFDLAFDYQDSNFGFDSDLDISKNYDVNLFQSQAYPLMNLPSTSKNTPLKLNSFLPTLLYKLNANQKYSSGAFPIASQSHSNSFSNSPLHSIFSAADSSSIKTTEQHINNQFLQHKLQGLYQPNSQQFSNEFSHLSSSFPFNSRPIDSMNTFVNDVPSPLDLTLKATIDGQYSKCDDRNMNCYNVETDINTKENEDRTVDLSFYEDDDDITIFDVLYVLSSVSKNVSNTTTEMNSTESQISTTISSTNSDIYTIEILTNEDINPTEAYNITDTTENFNDISNVTFKAKQNDLSSMTSNNTNHINSKNESIIISTPITIEMNNLTKLVLETTKYLPPMPTKMLITTTEYSATESNSETSTLPPGDTLDTEVTDNLDIDVTDNLNIGVTDSINDVIDPDTLNIGSPDDVDDTQQELKSDDEYYVTEFSGDGKDI